MKASSQLVRLEDGPLEIIDGDRGAHYPKQHEFFESGFCLFLNAGNVTKTGFNFDIQCQFDHSRRKTACSARVVFSKRYRHDNERDARKYSALFGRY